MSHCFQCLNLTRILGAVTANKNAVRFRAAAGSPLFYRCRRERSRLGLDALCAVAGTKPTVLLMTFFIESATNAVCTAAGTKPTVLLMTFFIESATNAVCTAAGTKPTVLLMTFFIESAIPTPYVPSPEQNPRSFL
jgi:hypothetical protein